MDINKIDEEHFPELNNIFIPVVAEFIQLCVKEITLNGKQEQMYNFLMKMNDWAEKNSPSPEFILPGCAFLMGIALYQSQVLTTLVSNSTSTIN